MSERFPGGIISKTAPVPTGPYENGTAPGVWTLDQQAAFVKQGIWPIAGLVPNYIEDVFSTWLYTGNGSTQTITNGIDLAGKGGLVWLKSRVATTAGGGSAFNQLFDSSRGQSSGFYIPLYSNTTDSQGLYPGSLYGGINNFGATGFTLEPGIFSDPYGNEATKTYASWTFREQPKFFDVVTYTGTGSVQNIAHNLGSTPGCIIVKDITTGLNWYVYHQSTGATQYLRLNSTDATTTFSGAWNDTAPTSTVFTVGTNANVNNSGDTYVAYVFAHNAGGFGLTGTDNVISCGSFTTDGSGNATVNLGYEPQWVMYKRADGAGSWAMFDNMRGMTVNTTNGDAILFANLADAESTVDWIQPTSTGFNPYNIAWNATYIYIAIRRGPMKVPTDGTKVFSPNLSNAVSGTAVTTGFPLDLQIVGCRPNYGLSVSNAFMDRLRGVSTTSTQVGNFLAATSTDAEVTNASTFRTLGWGNTGYNQDTYLSGAGAGIYWNFRRAPGFFDEVCYTGTGSARTVTHNLTVAPELMILKTRTGSGSEWPVYVAPLGATKGLYLGPYSDPAITTSAYWNDTAPTSSVFTVGSGSASNFSGGNFVAYLFATCAGVSKVGSYTGTGTTLQVNCGFTTGARFVLIKRTDASGDWYVWDSARGIVAGNDPYLLLNSTAAEVTSTDYVDTYSAGFEISSTAPAAINASGGNYIFLAIA